MWGAMQTDSTPMKTARKLACVMSNFAKEVHYINYVTTAGMKEHDF